MTVQTFLIVVDYVDAQVRKDDSKGQVIILFVTFSWVLNMRWHRLGKQNTFTQRAVNPVFFLLLQLNIMFFIIELVTILFEENIEINLSLIAKGSAIKGLRLVSLSCQSIIIVLISRHILCLLFIFLYQPANVGQAHLDLVRAFKNFFQERLSYLLARIINHGVHQIL